MDKRIDDIQDDEIRVIGRPSGNDSTGKPHRLPWIIAVIVVLCAIAAIAIFWPEKEENAVPAANEHSLVKKVVEDSEVIPLSENYSDTTSKAYTEHLKEVVNDIPLDIYIPHNAKPRLFLGTPSLDDRNVVFTTQAADIRADNGKIVGAFVLSGKPIAWGLSKKGFVGIIDGKITVGVADNSPLFEEATEKDGYFFRQYPLVDNGTLVENEPKGKSIRKAVCDRGGEIMVVMSSTPESFHDFAQALVDLKVDNAVYLVGSAFAYGYFRDQFGKLSIFYDKKRGGQKYENHLQWVVELEQPDMR